MLRRTTDPIDRYRILTLLGAFAFAYNAGVALHELGHVTAAVLTGGTVRSISLHPLGTSATAVAPDPEPFVNALGGPVLGSLAAVLAGRLAGRSRASAQPPLLALAAVVPIANGLGLIAGTLLETGDAAVLAREGLQPWTAITAGGVLLTVGATHVRPAMCAHGLDRSTPWTRRLAILLLGTGPYLGAIAIWNAIAVPADATVWLLLTGAGVAAVLLAAGPWFVPFHSAGRITRHHARVALAVGGGTVVAMVVAR